MSVVNSSKRLQIDFFGTSRTLRFNNYTIEQLVQNCAGGNYNDLERKLKALLAQSVLLIASHIVNAALAADDFITDHPTDHTYQQCKEWISEIPYRQVIEIINMFNDANDSPVKSASVPIEEEQNGVVAAETKKKIYRGKK